MKRRYVAFLLLVFLQLSLHSQNINNTLGVGGVFTIKNGTPTTFLSLSETNKALYLYIPLALEYTTSTTTGVITKGGGRFIHDYTAAGTDGKNTFMGGNSGNFTMSTSGATSLASYNTAVGHSTLTVLTTGYMNCAFGYISLYANSTGIYNSAFGTYALTANQSGGFNSAFGTQALSNNIAGNNNSAFGSTSLSSCTGSNNSAFGYNAGSNLTTGSNNSAFGYNAGFIANTTGSNNTVIGNGATASAAGINNEITLGNASIATLRCLATSITALSDARDKNNIRDLSLGLDFLMNVRPRQYNWDRRDWYENGKPDGTKMQDRPTAGFIAQELDEVQTKENVEWLNLVLKSNPDRLEATPGNLLPIMVKAIQELKCENDALRTEMTKLRASIAEQVKNEVKTALLGSAQQEGEKTDVSLNQTKD